MPDRTNKLRHQLVELLRGGLAHVAFEKAVADFPVGMRGTRPRGFAHSAWELVEHIRLAQSDLLEFTRDANHVSPPWPEGYWPSRRTPPSPRAWNQSCNAVLRGCLAMQAIVGDSATELLAPLPHDPEKTVLREALLLADHNAYHIAQLVQLRRALGTWKE